MGLTRGGIETIFGPKVSEVTECGAENLQLADPIGQYMLLALFHDYPSSSVREFTLQLLLRSEMANMEYSEGRNSLSEYLTDPIAKTLRYFHAVHHFTAVKLTVDNPNAVVLRKPTILEPVPGTTYYECSVLVEGKPTEGKAQIKAEMEGRLASARISVVRRDEEGPELTFKLVPYSLGSAFRATWDREEPNKLLITTTHESIRRYLGKADEGYPGQHSEAFRVLLAELIADNVCRRIVQEQARTVPMDVDQTYRLHSSLVLEFTPIAHKIQLQSPT